MTNTKQIYKLNLILEFIKFGNYKISNLEEIEYLNENINLKNLENIDNYIWIYHPIENTWTVLNEFENNVKSFYANLNDRNNIPKYLFEKLDTQYSNLLEIHFASIVNYLCAILKTINNNQNNITTLNHIYQNIPIINYTKIKGNNTEIVDNIYKKIKHFRDGLVHFEKPSKNIATTQNGGWHFFNMKDKNKLTFDIGEGALSIIDEVIPLIYEIVVNFIDCKIKTLVVKDKSDNTELFWDIVPNIFQLEFLNINDFNKFVNYEFVGNKHRIILTDKPFEL